MTKVLHVYKIFYPDSYGGIEQAIRHLALGCKVHGVSSEVFTLSRKPHPERFESESVLSRRRARILNFPPRLSPLKPSQNSGLLRRLSTLFTITIPIRSETSLNYSLV